MTAIYVSNEYVGDYEVANISPHIMLGRHYLRGYINGCNGNYVSVFNYNGKWETYDLDGLKNIDRSQVDNETSF